MTVILRQRARLRCCAAALVIVLAAPQALAQPGADESTADAPAAEARAHFGRGVTFYEEADYAAALVEFTRAYAIAPNWQVLFNIGQASFQVHDYAQALTTLRRFVDQGRGAIPPERRALVDGELADLVNRVGYAKLTSNVTGATLRVDDVLVGVTPLSDPVLVSVGLRKVTATRPGSEPVERQVSVPAGETVDVALDFSEKERSLAAAPEPELRQRTQGAPPPPPANARNRAPAFVAIGVGIAGVAVGSVFGALALHDKSRLDGECAPKACAPGSQGDIDRSARDGTVSTVAFGVAGFAAVAGLVLWATAGGSSSAAVGGSAPAPPASGVSLRWAPGIVAGTF